MKKCVSCSKKFTPNNGARKYCSLECSSRAQAERMRGFQAAVSEACKKIKTVHRKKCGICSKPFVATGVKKYCSEECSANALVQYRQRISEAARRIRQEQPREKARCRECGEVFEKQRWNQNFCGTECSKAAYSERLEIRGVWA